MSQSSCYPHVSMIFTVSNANNTIYQSLFLLERIDLFTDWWKKVLKLENCGTDNFQLFFPSEVSFSESFLSKINVQLAFLGRNNSACKYLQMRHLQRGMSIV